MYRGYYHLTQDPTSSAMYVTALATTGSFYSNVIVKIDPTANPVTQPLWSAFYSSTAATSNKRSGYNSSDLFQILRVLKF